VPGMAPRGPGYGAPVPRRPPCRRPPPVPDLTGWLRRAVRASGADLPGGDPRPTHGAEMEGWFWRLTDRERGRVVVALCGVNRHPDGDWAIVAVAAHPGRTVRSAVVDPATASADELRVHAGDVLRADDRSLEVRLDDAHLSVRLDQRVDWPLRLGGGGLGSVIPFLGQYWHPHVLGGRASGELRVGGETWGLDGADVYAEKNWGAGFPDRWWWGQVQGFTRRDLCVAFGGGRLAVGPVGVPVTGCVARVGDDVTVKRFRKTRTSIELHPENADFKTIVVPFGDVDFTLEGIAVGLIRNNMLM